MYYCIKYSSVLTINIHAGQENELLLMAVLDCLFNTVSGILRKNVDKKSLCDNMEVIMLAMDEMIDNGMIMESDPQQVRDKERNNESYCYLCR